MQSWHTTYLSLKDLPRELSAFELQAFFTYSRAEREVTLVTAPLTNLAWHCTWVFCA